MLKLWIWAELGHLDEPCPSRASAGLTDLFTELKSHAREELGAHKVQAKAAW